MNVTCCLSCGGNLVEQFSSVVDAQTGDTFGILRCDRCQLGHTSPQPEDLNRHYGDQYYGARHRFTKDWRMRKRWDLVRRAFAKHRGDRAIKNVLDIGCGDGTFIELAMTQGVKALGVEFDDHARKLRDMGLNVFETIDELPRDELFDVVTLWNSLEHVRDPKATLTAVRQLLRDDGIAIIAVPDAGGLQARTFGRDWFHLDVPRHLFHFTSGALVGLMERTGFAPKSWIHVEIEQDIFGWLQSSLNKLLPRPNVLFYSLVGATTGISSTSVALSYAASTVLGPFAMPAIGVELASRTGATMTVVALPK